MKKIISFLFLLMLCAKCIGSEEREIFYCVINTKKLSLKEKVTEALLNASETLGLNVLQEGLKGHSKQNTKETVTLLRLNFPESNPYSSEEALFQGTIEGNLISKDIGNNTHVIISGHEEVFSIQINTYDSSLKYLEEEFSSQMKTLLSQQIQPPLIFIPG